MKKVIALTAIAAVLAFAGCAGLKGPSDLDLVKQTCDAWGKALAAKDVQGVLATMSEDFASSQVASREALGELLQDAIDSGYLEEAEVSFTQTQYTAEQDGTYTVYPVDLSSAAGAVSAELKLKKVGKNWLICGLEVDGL
ncbi:MAG TPA: hypothetical protein PLO53_14180 [Candidatus Hydrogenedentes bacterium]|nr:hypothetical protein [Candidatus Hydrogenedentota bacterium]HPU99085.1 hypothetical protein [Candidatus Hydrogenedentota bacterium]